MTNLQGSFRRDIRRLSSLGRHTAFLVEPACMQIRSTGSLGVEAKPLQCGKPGADEVSQGVASSFFGHARDVSRVPVDLWVGRDLDGAGEERSRFGPGLRRVFRIYVGIREEGDVSCGDFVEEPGANGGYDV